SLSKKYSRRGVKEDQDTKPSNQQSFQDVLNQLNDYAAQREQLSENMTLNICVELSRNLQEMRQERKNHLCEVKKAQQNLESSFKLLETSKKRFEKEWREAEKANQQTERVQQEVSATKADVEKAKQNTHLRVHLADECKNEYASQLQRYNQEQSSFYHSEIPSAYKAQAPSDHGVYSCRGASCRNALTRVKALLRVLLVVSLEKKRNEEGYSPQHQYPVPNGQTHLTEHHTDTQFLSLVCFL
ncbi:hypothetical protein cypCar_00040711, partial [Cyprinus carpio]